ncbi:hypothetical protein [Flavobacterium sp.]|uniref:hypothetical protein n=1 Tax=Flavobacterium sp. TaxID=239 RepID=UPI0039E4330D
MAPGEQNESYSVRRGKFDSLTLYEVSEQELNIIEGGSTNSIFLNFAIFLLSIAISFFVTIFTFDFFPKDQEPMLVKFIVFLVVAILTTLVGLVCFILWIKSNDSFTDTIKKIKNRLKEENSQRVEDDESIDIVE